MTKKRLSTRWAAMKEFHLLRLVARAGNNATKKLYLRRQRIIAKAQLQIHRPVGRQPQPAVIVSLFD